MKIYAIINKKNLVAVENTKKSRYAVLSREGATGSVINLPAKRKLASREAARAYKRSLNNPSNWAIVDLRAGEAVR